MKVGNGQSPVSISDEAVHDLVGRSWSLSRTIGEYDVLSFAGVTGDLAANHTDDDYMRANGFDGRIAHGVLLLGYTSALSTRVADLLIEPVVSAGYDRVRFVAPVPLGTTITASYSVVDIDRLSRKIFSETRIEIPAPGEASGNTVALAATHRMKVLET